MDPTYTADAEAYREKVVPSGRAPSSAFQADDPGAPVLGLPKEPPAPVR